MVEHKNGKESELSSKDTLRKFLDLIYEAKSNGIRVIYHPSHYGNDHMLGGDDYAEDYEAGLITCLEQGLLSEVSDNYLSHVQELEKEEKAWEELDEQEKLLYVSLKQARSLSNILELTDMDRLKKRIGDKFGSKWCIDQVNASRREKLENNYSEIKEILSQKRSMFPEMSHMKSGDRIKLYELIVPLVEEVCDEYSVSYEEVQKKKGKIPFSKEFLAYLFQTEDGRFHKIDTDKICEELGEDKKKLYSSRERVEHEEHLMKVRMMQVLSSDYGYESIYSLLGEESDPFMLRY